VAAQSGSDQTVTMPDNEQSTAPEVLLLTFRRERETKNMVRYEEVASDTPSVVGTLYLQKWAHHRLGEPEVITVQIGGSGWLS
jgi:hypothetical protein